MLILGIETCLASGFIFLGTEEKILLSRKISPHSASESLVPLISSLLQENNVSIDDIGALAVTQGPGSFTSLRVGIVLAKALSFSRTLPLVAVPTLSLVAFSLPISGIICSLIPAYRNSFFAAFFKKDRDNLEIVGAQFFLPFVDLIEYARKFAPTEVLFACPARDVCTQVEDVHGAPSFFEEELQLEASLLKWAVRDIKLGKTVDPLVLKPIYISAPLVHRK